MIIFLQLIYKEIPTCHSNSFLYKLNKRVGFLSLLIEPSNSQVKIDGKDYSGIRKIELEPGAHTIVLSSAGFRSIQDVIEIDQNSTLKKEYHLTELVGKLSFKIFPNSAEVTLSNEKGYKNFWMGYKYLNELPIGIYKIAASEKGFKKYEQTIEIKENQTTSLNITMEKGKDTGRIYDRLSDDLLLYVNNVYVSQVKVLEEGKYDVSVSYGKQEVFNEHVELLGGQSLEVRRNYKIDKTLYYINYFIPGVIMFDPKVSLGGKVIYSLFLWIIDLAIINEFSRIGTPEANETPISPLGGILMAYSGNALFNLMLHSTYPDFDIEIYQLNSQLPVNFQNDSFCLNIKYKF